MIYPPIKLVTGKEQVMKESVIRFKRIKRFIQHVEATLRERYAPGRKPAEPLQGGRVVRDWSLGIIDVHQAPSRGMGIRGGGDYGVRCRFDPESGEIRNLFISFRKSVCNGTYHGIAYSRTQGMDFYMVSTRDVLHSRYLYAPSRDELTVIEDDPAGTDRILRKFPSARESRVVSWVDKPGSELLRERDIYKAQREVLMENAWVTGRQRSVRRQLERKIALINGMVYREKQAKEAVA